MQDFVDCPLEDLPFLMSGWEWFWGRWGEEKIGEGGGTVVDIWNE